VTGKKIKTRFLAVCILSLLVLSACSHAPKPGPGSYLYPLPAVEQEGYATEGRSMAFESDAVKISVQQARKDEAHGKFIAGLLEKDYVIFNVSIENKSAHRIIYNPAYTVLTTDSLDYKKPLDFTDLYDITGNEQELSGLKGRFYDLNVTLMPGEKTSRLLIFRPVSKEAAKAKVAIKEIYIGTTTERFSFPFAFGDSAQ
jgi:hypothetical protein